MSFDIGSVGRTPAPASTQTTRTSAPGPVQTTGSGDTVTVDTIPASPPQEVQDEEESSSLRRREFLWVFPSALFPFFLELNKPGMLQILSTIHLVVQPVL